MNKFDRDRKLRGLTYVQMSELVEIQQMRSKENHIKKGKTDI